MSGILIIAVVVCAYAAQTVPPDEQLNQQGIAYFRQAKYVEAEQAYRKALELYRAVTPANAPGYGTLLNNLSAALEAQGRIVEARQVAEECLALEPRLGEKRDPVIAHALNRLALIHRTEREYTRAISLLQRALTISKANSGVRAATLHNLGAAYFEIGQKRKAESLLEESVAMYREGGDHSQIPATLTYLANLAADRGDDARAESLLGQALDMRRSQFGDTHPHVALTLCDIGQLQRQAKQYGMSAEKFQQALDIAESAFGKDHIFLAPVLFNFGETRRLQGRHTEALALFERSIQILQQHYGPEHARLGVVYRAAAESSAKLKRKEKAKSYTARAQTIISRIPDYEKHTIDMSAFLPQK
jgi:tetratricopeptide (TPR) repeat protein